MPAPDTIRSELIELARDGLGFPEFARTATRALRRRVPFDAVAVMAFDPVTAMPIDMWSLPEVELHEADIARFRQLAESGRRVARDGTELWAVCVGELGMWGAMLLRREPGAPDFTTRDEDLLASLSFKHAAVQRARLDVETVADDRGFGLLLLDDENGVELANTGAVAWLEDLPGQGRALPLVVTAVAERARAIASGRSGGAATARVRTASGHWLVVSGSVLSNGAHASTAIALEPARATDIAEIIANAHGLTARERRVTTLVAQGLPTAAIAARLHLSAYTVQDHLKAIFEKLGVSSRGELVARLFLDHGQLDAA